MWVRGIEIKSPELRELIKQAIDRAGAAIIATIATIWTDDLMGEVASNFARVLVMGGGSWYFMGHIQSRIPTAQRLPDPEYQNAQGYARLAQRATERMS